MQIYYTHNFKGTRGESHKLLERALGFESIDSLLVKGELGKPYLPEGPEFSISHSRNTWAVLKAGAVCGLDVQYIKDCDVLKLAERWYHPDEVAALSDASGGELRGSGVEELAGEFFRIWTRREALVKAVGRSIVDSTLPSTLDDVVEYEGGRWQIRDIEIPGMNNGYAAMCYATDIDYGMEEIEYIALD